MVELHAHTTASDGRLGPAELVHLAGSRGVTHLAVTDHDTTQAFDVHLYSAAGAQGVTLIGGVEASATLPFEGVHLLGLGIRPDAEQVQSLVSLTRVRREERAHAIVGRLAGLGIHLTMESLHSEEAAVVTRPHIADALVRTGRVGDVREAFERYLARGAEAFVPLEAIDAGDWIDAIHAAGGLVFLAHPGDYTRHRSIQMLADRGLDGLEVWHPSHDESLIVYYKELADRWGLLCGGGSDFHGRSELETERIGTFSPPGDRLGRLLERLPVIGG